MQVLPELLEVDYVLSNDLISRNALVEKLLLKKAEPMQHGISTAIAAVLDQPYVDVEPVRHGYNATDGHPSDQFVCSCCGFNCEITEIKCDDDKLSEPDAYEYDCKFCPNCGARMEEGNSDDNMRHSC